MDRTAAAGERPRLSQESARVAAAAAGAPVGLVELALEMVLGSRPPRGWQRDRACVDTPAETFYVPRGRSTAQARAICSRCDVQAECLAQSLLSNEPYGIWGGLVERQRRVLRNILGQLGALDVVGEQRHLVWAEPGAGTPPDGAEAVDPAPESRATPQAPRAHQLEAVREITAELDEHESVQIAMATGTGKTLVGLLAAEAMDSRTVVVFVPSRQLIAQTARVWLANLKGPSRMIAVCSDAGELALPVTTDPEALRATAEAAEAAGERLVVFATYQSSKVVASADIEVDLAVADEAHHLAGPVNKAFAAIVRGEVRARRRLYMTATPRTSLSVRETSDVEARGMDDPAFGRRVYHLDLNRAIEAGLVADYRVVVAAVDAATFERVSALLGKNFDPSLVAGAIAVVRAIARYELSSVLSFHTRVDRAANFAALVGEVADVLDFGQRPPEPGMAGWIDGATSVRIRNRLLDRLAAPGSWGVISNAKALGEGVDLPSLDAVALCDPKNSEVEVAQAVGRALRRPASGRSDKVGLVILPVLLTADETPDDPLAGIDRRSLQTVAGALRALRGYDSALASRLDNVRRRLGSQGRRVDAFVRRLAGESFVRSRIDFDLPGGATGILAQAMALEVVRETTSEWHERFGELCTYVDEHGSASIAQATVIDVGGEAVDLGRWCSSQRALRARGMLSPEREGLLEGLPGWTWTPRDDRWTATFETLRRHVDLVGAGAVTQKTVAEGQRIGSFVNTARMSYKSGTLSKRRIELFESLPGWRWDARAEAWDEHLEALQRFVARHGHARPSQGDLVDGFDVGRWVSKQRALIHAGELDPSRAARLQALPGWVDDEVAARWEENFARLVNYVGEHGSPPPQSARSSDGYLLGAWVSKQRLMRAKGRLADGRATRLEALPGWSWTPRAGHDSWSETYALLERYVAEQGHARVPDGAVYDGTRLGQWVGFQRQEFRKGRLAIERAERLMEVPGWVWSSHDAAFAANLELLHDFARRNGHCDMPTGHVERGVKLGQWVRRQHVLYAAGKLAPERREQLRTVPGWSWQPEVRAA